MYVYTLKVFTGCWTLENHSFAGSIVLFRLPEMNNFSSEVVAHFLILREALIGQLLRQASYSERSFLDYVKAKLTFVVSDFHIAKSGGHIVQQEVGPIKVSTTKYFNQFYKYDDTPFSYSWTLIPFSDASKKVSNFLRGFL